MSKQCPTCKTVGILPLHKLFPPLTWNPQQYMCIQCKKIFTEEEYTELDEGGYIPELSFVTEEIISPVKINKRFTLFYNYMLNEVMLLFKREEQHISF